MPKHIVVLTGAGVSAESGLGTFRDRPTGSGRVRPEEVATPEAFARDPARVLAFYNARRAQLVAPNVAPNAAHLALAELERRCGRATACLVTQNIDDLHERAGSARAAAHARRVAERPLHRLSRDPALSDSDLDRSQPPVPTAAGTAGMRPDVVWFGEMPLHMERIATALARCGLFVAIGTSGSGLSGRRLRRRGARLRRADLRDQPRGGRQRLLLRRGALRPGERDGPGLG